MSVCGINKGTQSKEKKKKLFINILILFSHFHNFLSNLLRELLRDLLRELLRELLLRDNN